MNKIEETRKAHKNNCNKDIHWCHCYREGEKEVQTEFLEWLEFHQTTLLILNNKIKELKQKLKDKK